MDSAACDASQWEALAALPALHEDTPLTGDDIELLLATYAMRPLATASLVAGVAWWKPLVWDYDFESAPQRVRMAFTCSPAATRMRSAMLRLDGAEVRIALRTAGTDAFSAPQDAWLLRVLALEAPLLVLGSLGILLANYRGPACVARQGLTSVAACPRVPADEIRLGGDDENDDDVDVARVERVVDVLHALTFPLVRARQPCTAVACADSRARLKALDDRRMAEAGDFVCTVLAGLAKVQSARAPH